MDTTETTKPLTMHVPSELHAQLDALARATGRIQQDVALEALQRYIEDAGAYAALIEERQREAHAGAFAAPERVAAVWRKYETQPERVG